MKSRLLLYCAYALAVLAAVTPSLRPADPAPPVLKIVAVPGSSAPVPPAGVPVPLDPGKFLWLDLKGYEGVPEWDFLDSPAVVVPPAEAGAYWGGWKQGDQAPAWHKLPPNAIPLPASAVKIDAGKFTWYDLPDVAEKRFGGHKQLDGQPGWHAAPSKSAVPCLGVVPGRVTVSAWGVLDGKAKKLASLLIDVGPAPPEPKPDPKPDPKPTPVTDSAWLIVVEETAERTAATARVLGDLNYWNTVKARGSNWRFYDKDSPDAAAKKYPAMVAGTPLPALLVLSADGEKIKAVPLPQTTAGVDAVLKEITGK